MGSRAALINSIRDEYEQETGERPSAAVADVFLDERAATFVNALEGAGAEYAVAKDPQVAEWLGNLWVGKNGGEDGRKVRAALKEYRAREAAAKLAERARGLVALWGQEKFDAVSSEVVEEGLLAEGTSEFLAEVSKRCAVR